MNRFEQLTKAAARTELEDTLAKQIHLAGLPAPVREYRFLLARKYRFDFAWPLLRIAVEVEGGVWNQGRHLRPAGFEADAEKYAEAVLDGWRVLRVTGDMVKDGRAVNYVYRILTDTVEST